MEVKWGEGRVGERGEKTATGRHLEHLYQTCSHPKTSGEQGEFKACDGVQRRLSSPGRNCLGRMGARRSQARS